LTIVRSASSVAADDASVCHRRIPKPPQSSVRSRARTRGWVGARTYARVCACGCERVCVSTPLSADWGGGTVGDASQKTRLPKEHELHAVRIVHARVAAARAAPQVLLSAERRPDQ
jgi:hypothetical protein